RGVAAVDGTPVRGRAIGGQSAGEVLQRATAAPGQPDREAADGQLGGGEPAAIPRRPQQQHIAGLLAVSGQTDLRCRRHSTPLLWLNWGSLFLRLSWGSGRR